MTAETDKAALRDNLVRACFDPGSFIGPRGVRTTDEWRADACLHLLASILAQAEADRAALDNAQKLNRDLHRRTQKAERFRARWGGSAVNYVIAKIKERRARRAAEARADRLAAEVEALRAEHQHAVLAFTVYAESGHGGARHEAYQWLRCGACGPVRYDGGALFRAWAEQNGIENRNGFLARAADKPGERTDG